MHDSTFRVGRNSTVVFDKKYSALSIVDQDTEPRAVNIKKNSNYLKKK